MLTFGSTSIIHKHTVLQSLYKSLSEPHKYRRKSKWQRPPLRVCEFVALASGSGSDNLHRRSFSQEHQKNPSTSTYITNDLFQLLWLTRIHSSVPQRDWEPDERLICKHREWVGQHEWTWAPVSLFSRLLPRLPRQIIMIQGKID